MSNTFSQSLVITRKQCIDYKHCKQFTVSINTSTNTVLRHCQMGHDIWLVILPTTFNKKIAHTRSREVREFPILINMSKINNPGVGTRTRAVESNL